MGPFILRVYWELRGKVLRCIGISIYGHYIALSYADLTGQALYGHNSCVCFRLAAEGFSIGFNEYTWTGHWVGQHNI